MNHALRPDGTEMIVLTRAEYDRLIASAEDIADGALLDAALAEAEGKPTMPADLVMASLDGTLHPLTAWRKAVGVTIAALSDQSGVRAATISDIERGKIDPRYSTVQALAAALRLEPDDIMP